MAEIRARLTLDDDFSAQIKKSIEGTDLFAQSIIKAKTQMKDLSAQRFEATIKAKDEATKKITEAKKAMESMKKNVAITIAAKDVASESIHRIKGHLELLGSKTFSPIIRAKDEASSVIKTVSDKLFSLKTMAAGIVLGGAGKGLYDFTLGQGVNNEKYLATLQTTLNSKKKGQDALGWAYKTALKTPFEASQVVEGVSGLAVSQLDYKKFLLPLGNLAAVKNRPLDQAIEFASTLASGDMGEAVERGRDLGISRQMWEKAGMKFDKQGSLTNSPNEALNAVLQIIKNNHWNKLMENQSKTAGGNMSNIGDTIKSMGRELAGIDQNGAIVKGGLFDNFKKQIVTIQPMLEKVQKSQAFKTLAKDIGNLATAGGQKLQSFLKSFDNPGKIKQYEFTIKEVFGDIKAVGTVGIAFIKGAATVLMPLIKTAAAHPKVIAGLFAGITVGKGVLNVATTFNSIKKEFPILNTAAKMFSKNFGSSIKGIGPVLKGFGKDFLIFTRPIQRGFNTVLGTTRLWAGTIGSVLRTKMVSGARAGASGVVNALRGISQTMVSVASTTGRFVARMGVLLGKNLMKVLRTVASGIVGIIRPLFALIAANPIILVIGAIIGACVLLYEAWKHNWGGIQEKTRSVIANIKKWWGELKAFFAHPIKGTINILKSIGNKITGKGNALGTSYWEGGPTWLAENGPEIVDLPAGSRIYNNRQTMGMLNPKNIASPNMGAIGMAPNIANKVRQMKAQITNWGKDIPLGLAKGIKNNTKPVTDATTLMANKIRELIHFTAPDKGPLSDFDTYPVDMLKTFGNGIQNNTKLVTTPTTDMTSSTKAIINNNLIQRCPTLGKWTVQEIGAGIQSEESNLVAIVKQLTDKVILAFRESFGISSPSRVMYKLSQFIPQGVIKGISSVDMQKFIKRWIGDVASYAGGAMGNVSTWLSVALAITGTPASWLPGLMKLASAESGGNPLAINLWDSNAAAGHPSKGLMQMIDTAFNRWKLPGLDNIWNPIANAAAAIRYIKARYGSIFGTPLNGYAVGLTRVPKDNLPALLHEDERVLTANEARNYDKKNDGKPNIIINMYGTIVRENSDIDKIATALAKKIKTVAFNM